MVISIKDMFTKPVGKLIPTTIFSKAPSAPRRQNINFTPVPKLCGQTIGAGHYEGSYRCST